MVEKTFFTCIGRGHGAPVLPATREDWEKMRSEAWLAEMCRRIGAGDEKLKAKLPVWTPSCAEFKDNHRAVKDAVKPLPRLMLDFDEKGHSQEILAKAMELMKAGKWDVLLVEESVRRGTHVLITLPEGMTPQEAQTRFSADVGFYADPALKDVARCIYMVPSTYTLFLSPKLFEEDESCPQMTQIITDTKSDEDNVTEENPCQSVPSVGEKEYPEVYEGINYKELVSTLEEQMGGAPEHGSRNNFIFSMACHLRYVCNDEPEWIAQVLPTYGEARDKWMATIRSACARSQTKQMPRIMKRTLEICKRDSQLTTHNSQLNNTPPRCRKTCLP